MSDAPASTPAASEKPAKKPGIVGMLSVVIGLALSGAFFAPTTIIFAAGMLPTFVMGIIDTSPDRRGMLAVGVMNFAGVLPFIISVWKHGHTTDAAYRILSEPVNWLVMLGAAGMASAIYIYVPKSIAVFSALRAQSEIAQRRALQKKLAERWGDQVSSQKNLSDLIAD